MKDKNYYQISLKKVNDIFDEKLKNKFFFTTKKSINNKRLKAIKNLEDFYNM